MAALFSRNFSTPVSEFDKFLKSAGILLDALQKLLKTLSLLNTVQRTPPSRILNEEQKPLEIQNRDFKYACSLFDRCEKYKSQNGGSVKMSLFRDAVFKRWPYPIELIFAEKKKINLKPLNKVTIRFDPFGDNVSHIRKFNLWIHEPDIIKTNPKCLIKTEILTNRSEPHIIFNLTDGKEFIFKCTNLKTLEIFQLMNKYITPLAPKEELVTAAVPKMQKKK